MRKAISKAIYLFLLNPQKFAYGTNQVIEDLSLLCLCSRPTHMTFLRQPAKLPIVMVTSWVTIITVLLFSDVRVFSTPDEECCIFEPLQKGCQETVRISYCVALIMYTLSNVLTCLQCMNTFTPIYKYTQASMNLNTKQCMDKYTADYAHTRISPSLS